VALPAHADHALPALAGPAVRGKFRKPRVVGMDAALAANLMTRQYAQPPEVDWPQTGERGVAAGAGCAAGKPQ
jgi:hypothetical protein